jgi:MFS family permease
LIVYAAKTWDLSDAQSGAFVIAMQVGQALSYLIFGFLSDRKGHKLSLEICLLLNVVTLGLAVMASNPLWFYPIFFLRGAVFAGAYLSGVAIVFEFTGAENRPTYIGVANTIPGVAGTLAPLIGGWLAGAVNYPFMFIVSTFIGVLSLATLHFAVREPRLKESLF